MSKSEKSIWDIAIDHVDKTRGDDKEEFEATLLFIGSKASGKTSMILKFLDRDEPPKPTTALEYTFGRRAKGHNISKDIGHIWELGGGTWLSKLIDVPIHAENIRHCSVAIVLDLSKPNELWFVLETLLKSLRSRVESVIGEVRSKDPSIGEKMKKAAWQRIEMGQGHPDRDLLDLFPIPLVIIGGKYDIFQDFDSEKRKTICKTLRFVAHTYGAHLQFCSTKHDALMNKVRSLMGLFLFDASTGKASQLDHNKPLSISPGQDSLQQIGTPPLSEDAIGRVSARTPMELWKTAFASHFTPETSSDKSTIDDPAKDPQYAEHAVDNLRIQKNEELEHYRRLAERRAKEESKNAMVEGFA